MGVFIRQITHYEKKLMIHEAVDFLCGTGKEKMRDV